MASRDGFEDGHDPIIASAVSDRAVMSATTMPTIHALTGIRALAAGWVVLEHFRQPIYDLLPWSCGASAWINSGYLGVEVFFVLSGFILSYNYAERFRVAGLARATYYQFLASRFARIYPVHIFSLLCVTLLMFAAAASNVALNSQSRYSPLSFAGNLLLLQALPGLPAWNGPAWSISCEALAYVAFPLLALVVVRSGGRRAAANAVIVLALEVALILVVFMRDPDFSDTSIVLFWLRIGGEFTAGCFLWAAWRRMRCKAHWRWDVIAVLAFLASVAIVELVNAKSALNFLCVPFLALLVIAAASSSGLVRATLAGRLVQWGGRISYSVYLTHYIILNIGAKMYPWTNFSGSPLPVRIGFLVAYLIAVLAFGAGVFHLIEEPARRLVRQRMVGSRKPSLVASPDVGRR